MEPVKCVHCGDDCGKYPVVWDDKNFCCHGCKSVYQILNQNKLNKYYTIVDTPGVRVDKQDYGNKYAYLDNEEIREKLLDFSEGSISKVTLFIPSIHCSSCIWLLENMHLMDKGIKNSLVNFTKKEVSITFNTDEISLRRLVELLASIHYIPQITLDNAEGTKKPGANTTLLAKIGVAGFAFGNIMLFSFPEYLSIREELEGGFKDFFSWINVLLSLPVLFFSSRDYLLSAFKNLRHKIVNIDLPISIGILALVFQSYFEIFTGTGPGYLDSFAGFIFFLLIGKWYQDKTYKSLAFDRDYKSYFPVAVTRITTKGEESTPLKDLVAGNRILIRNQELIPTDGKILGGHGNIDYSFVTGESVPVAKHVGDFVFAGGKQIGPAIEIEVKRNVAQSQLTRLWNQKTSSEKSVSRITSLIDRLSRNFTIAVLGIAALTAVHWYLTDPSVALMAFTSVLIVACPCAIALSMPFSFGTTMRSFGHRGFYLKNTDVVERLTKIDTVVFDKTGTITYNRSKQVKLAMSELEPDEMVAVKSLARQSAHPLSAAVFDFLEVDHIGEVEEFMEIPSSGVKGRVEGRQVKMGSAAFVLGKETGEDIFASEVFVSIDGVYKARFEVKNKYRRGMEEILGYLSKNHEVHLISGDNEAEKERLAAIFGNAGNLHFNQSPGEKLEYINALKAKNRKVLMIGDGLNDAGALNASDVGISIADDIYQFSPACDAILEAEQFSRLDKFIRFAGVSLNIVKISYLISILYNIIGLTFAVQGLLSPIIAAILMPLSSVTVVSFVTFATRIAAKYRLPVN
jgi:P-type Cu+ transporter